MSCGAVGSTRQRTHTDGAVTGTGVRGIIGTQKPGSREHWRPSAFVDSPEATAVVAPARPSGAVEVVTGTCACVGFHGTDIRVVLLCGNALGGIVKSVSVSWGFWN